MKIYFYCSYTNSKYGFSLTRLEKNKLIPESLCNSADEKERLIDRFFSYDNFQVLWLELPRNLSFPFFTDTQGAFFGVRDLKGKIEGRDAVLNMVFLAEKGEENSLYRIAQGVLQQWPNFAEKIFGCMSLGGVRGYQIDSERFYQFLENFSDDKQQFNRKFFITGKELLHLAVYVDTWDSAAEQLKAKWFWKTCSKNIIHKSEFDAFLERVAFEKNE